MTKRSVQSRSVENAVLSSFLSPNTALVTQLGAELVQKIELSDSNDECPEHNENWIQLNEYQI